MTFLLYAFAWFAAGFLVMGFASANEKETIEGEVMWIGAFIWPVVLAFLIGHRVGRFFGSRKP